MLDTPPEAVVLMSAHCLKCQALVAPCYLLTLTADIAAACHWYNGTARYIAAQHEVGRSGAASAASCVRACISRCLGQLLLGESCEQGVSLSQHTLCFIGCTSLQQIKVEHSGIEAAVAQPANNCLSGGVCNTD